MSLDLPKLPGTSTTFESQEIDSLSKENFGCFWQLTIHIPAQRAATMVTSS